MRGGAGGVARSRTIHAYVGRYDKQYDTGTGLILMGARPYDPTTGRFLSIDPIDGGSLNNSCDESEIRVVKRQNVTERVLLGLEPRAWRELSGAAGFIAIRVDVGSLPLVDQRSRGVHRCTD